MNSKNSILHEESLSVIDSNEEILEFTDEKVELEIKKDSHKKSQKILNIMVVDDEKEVHDVTRMVLANYSFEDYQVKFIDAYSAKEAKEKLATAENLALILLDVVMEDDSSGLELVKYIREDLKNKFVRIILRTGQPGQAPEEEVITNYDINDYKSKIELTARKLSSFLCQNL
jgi:CheY-like chemotaxis protein